MNWFVGLEEICQADAPLAPLTWYRLGGPARWLLRPRSEQELAQVLHRCAEAGISWRVLGRGANVLVRDSGFDGAVVQLCGPQWDQVRWKDPVVYAAAGVDFPALVRASIGRGLGGLENLAGIPGTVGGVIRMNAGGRYGCIGDYVQSVRLMEPSGRVAVRPRQQVSFSYRRAELGDCIVLGATFLLTPGDRDQLQARCEAIWREKRASQPPLSARSAGCVFKNPPGQAAGKLLEQAGLKGLRVGGASISTKHANFIVVDGDATASDVLELIELARRRVREQSGIELELEVDIW
jgi:UDP-N-acetylmuramate dehydrogenase